MYYTLLTNTQCVLHIRTHRQRDPNQSKISNNTDVGMNLMRQRFHQTRKKHTHEYWCFDFNEEMGAPPLSIYLSIISRFTILNSRMSISVFHFVISVKILCSILLRFQANICERLFLFRSFSVFLFVCCCYSKREWRVCVRYRNTQSTALWWNQNKTKLYEKKSTRSY